MVLFNPDGGCTQDVEVTLKEDEDGTPIVVRVRAMTGAVTVRKKSPGTGNHASPTRRPPARHTLLEVLGATAIFLMSIVAIGELMSSSTDQALEVQFRSRATRLCQSKLNEFAAGVEN